MCLPDNFAVVWSRQTKPTPHACEDPLSWKQSLPCKQRITMQMRKLGRSRESSLSLINQREVPFLGWAVSGGGNVTLENISDND
jgi:hypothetical protein